MKHVVIVAFLATLASPAGSDPEGFALWTASQLRGYEKQLKPKLSPQKFAAEQLGKFGNHSFMVAHREGNGEAELHETQADVFFVQSGQATLIVGGQVVDGKTTAPNEIRGPSIQGGEKRQLRAGDMAHIAAKTPHQVMVDAGKQITYVVVKVDVQ